MMTRHTWKGPGTSVPVARVVRPADPRVEELAREERIAVERGDWNTARVCVLERAALREVRERLVARRLA